MDTRTTNNALPAWLIATVVAAGMTAYADDCGRPPAGSKPAPARLATDEDPNARNDTLPPAH